MVLLRTTFALAAVSLVSGQQSILSGIGHTGTYYDCCKPSCAWPEKGPWLTHPVNTCAKDNSPLKTFDVGSACGEDGKAYVCNDQQPIIVNETFAYGFISAFIVGATERDWCCSCYDIQFINGTAEGKRMIVQATNTGYDDPKKNIFGIAAAGAPDYANGCMNRYDSNGGGFLGKTGDELVERAQCAELPQALQKSCYWRFDWFNDSWKPNMTFTRVKCPSVLTDRTGCIRSDEDTFATTSAASPTLSTGFFQYALALALFGFGVNL